MAFDTALPKHCFVVKIRHSPLSLVRNLSKTKCLLLKKYVENVCCETIYVSING